MPYTDADRTMLQSCLTGDPAAWQEFVDRFVGVVFHVVRHSAHMRSHKLQEDEVEDLVAEIMARLIEHDYRILRHFRGHSSLATYLAVIARRVAVNAIARKQAVERMKSDATTDPSVPPELRIDTEDEIQRLLDALKGREADLVRSYYLENKSYEAISQEMGIPSNSIGPMLTRLRRKMREVARD